MTYDEYLNDVHNGIWEDYYTDVIGDFKSKYEDDEKLLYDISITWDNYFNVALKAKVFDETKMFIKCGALGYAPILLSWIQDCAMTFDQYGGGVEMDGYTEYKIATALADAHDSEEPEEFVVQVDAMLDNVNECLTDYKKELEQELYIALSKTYEWLCSEEAYQDFIEHNA